MMPESETPDLTTEESVDDEERDYATDVQLQELEGRLSGAVADLNKRNRDVESYLDTLAQERRRELEGTAADQMTLDDIAPVPEDVAPPAEE